MKSERRHELQHNDLADWILNTYESITPYKNSILGVMLLVIVALIAGLFWRSRSASQAADGWNMVEIPQALVQCPMFQIQPVYVFPQYLNMMEAASTQHSGTPAGEWAEILTADSYLVAGVDKLMVPGQKEAGTDFLEKAKTAYEKALATIAAPLARERAMFGKARALESSGALKDAAEAYDSLNKDFPKGTYKAIADQRLEQLRTPEAEEFYKALAAYAPKPKAEGPKGKLDKLAPLSENPPNEPTPKSSASPTNGKPEASKSSAANTLPEAPLAPLGPTIPQVTPATTAVVPRTEPPKADAAKSSTAIPAAPKSSSAPSASSASPAKKDK